MQNIIRKMAIVDALTEAEKQPPAAPIGPGDPGPYQASLRLNDRCKDDSY